MLMRVDWRQLTTWNFKPGFSSQRVSQACWLCLHWLNSFNLYPCNFIIWKAAEHTTTNSILNRHFHKKFFFLLHKFPSCFPLIAEQVWQSRNMCCLGGYPVTASFAFLYVSIGQQALGMGNCVLSFVKSGICTITIIQHVSGYEIRKNIQYQVICSWTLTNIIWASQDWEMCDPLVKTKNTSERLLSAIIQHQ